MRTPYELTKDGWERQWQVNYLAPFVLTSSLMPALLQGAARCQQPGRVRVVTVCSDLAFRGGPKNIHFQDVNMSDASGMMATM
jgi:NAD(P)-dependent dehydrogenase (short-subunit alcohol dehydrogenase family)